MKRIVPVIIFTVMLTQALLTQQSPEVIGIGKYKLGICFYSQNIVRVHISASDSFSTRKSLSIIASPQKISIKKEIFEKTLVLSSDSISVVVSLENGSLQFIRKSGIHILKSAGIDTASFIQDIVAGEAVFHIKQGFLLSPEEGVYGLGQYEDPIMNYRGHDILISQANRTSVNPFLISTNGYGILWDNYSKSRFVDSPQGAYFWSEVADEIDYYFCSGSMDATIAQYRLLTGVAPMFGKWAYGYWQSKERYKTEEELLNVLKEYRSRKIPLDNLVQDWNYWPGAEQFSSMTWDSTRFPSPRKMVDSIHRANAHIIVSIWPAFGNQSNLYKEMKENGFLYPVEHWNNGLVYDAYNPLARSIYWKYVKKGLFDIGIDGFWTDATEPEFRCTDDRFITEMSMKQAGTNALGTFARYLNSYSLMTTKGLYENQRNATNAKRVFLLTRSSYAGQQRNGAATWSGDTFASWDNLKVQIASGINFSMSGIPYWNSDIGGFITNFHFLHGFDDPAYKELYVRWFQFGAFSPIFRAHGTDIAREIWRFGANDDQVFKALLTADRLRYRLMPYIYSVAWKVTNEGYSFLRGLPMSYSRDTYTYNITDQFFFGPSIMVRPVTRPFSYEPGFGGIDITPEHFLSPNGKEHGSEISIYRGLMFDKLVLNRKIDVGQIAWFGCIPSELDSVYSVSILGQLKADTSGIHTIYIKTNGGIRLWMGDSLLVNNPENHDERTFQTTIMLTSYQSCPFRIEHRQFIPQTANFKLNWKKPGTPSITDTKINLYLPNHELWYDFWTGASILGGQTIKVTPPLNQIPLYIPAGSIIPVGPEIQYATERSSEPIELRVYPGKDGEFVLYDDEGDTYNYERGYSAQIPILWNDSKKTLTIGTQIGSYPRAPKQQIFHIVLVKSGHGSGIENTSNPDKIIHYKQRAVTIKL